MLMNHLFAGKKDGTTLAQKVVVEQLTSNPLNNIIYMSYIGFILEGRNLTSLKSKLQNEYPGVQLNSWKFWPVISVITYKYVPVNLRVLFGNLAAVCWANYVKWRVLSSAKVPIVSTGALKKAF